MAEETNKETIAGTEPEEEILDSSDLEEAQDSGENTEESTGENAGEKTGKDTGENADADPEEGKDAGPDETGKTEGASSKKSFFKKKKDKKDEKIEELNDRLMRQMAEFENFRKRTDREKSQMFDLGAKSVIEKILPVIDNFERGLAQAADQEDPFVQGMEKIYKSMLQELESIGVKPIEAEGKEFDPNLHNAVMHCEDESAGENIIVQELQKGYTYHDSVVRHSMVKVAN